MEQARFELAVGGGRHGRAYRELLDDLWIYSWPVVRSLIRTNRINSVIKQYAPYRMVAITPEDLVVLAHSEEERDALALDVIIDAVSVFERSVIKLRKWDPTRGASLRTWFIGICALGFPRSYEKWSAARSGRMNDLARVHDVDWKRVADTLADSVGESSGSSMDRELVRDMFAGAQPMTILIFNMIMQGHEIA